ncbi:endomembrane protein 70, putative [Plasmodium knowlesi strain H]|uniref:Transmembrane 9 superfamily member n=3 Tax=Plasmodium knowlesi TaxID=5850 RepID=A0A5K1USL8_PLAKH|nr:endomembrane protein 70, putative [Plasmodium knowlesi strain H]OTN68304.1 Transmembrane 9 superfamily member [Plasmodium knowlesi]CAA9987107.1 endomembrane protein 70, putative [Plasmodium knowlesi strain H]SBO23847.1 endomembrane protein 70, putative [Plasmodium knowlesi strain H]SBO25650.1 endomembrane protein 70, putative [Plasmodium knowlesi strain H]VVS76581.1 endomembrane protein 70, putative [Plasmodium knowlesi strain H]|eukprot:XP_002261729.1 endomembrane protein, putative [Plasmodium knowlesi strain H]
MIYKFFFFALVVVFLHCVQDVASYLPGMNPTIYKKGDKVIISVKNLSSRRAVTSLDYFTFPLCSADNPSISGEEAPNIFKILSGDHLHTTSIQTTFLRDTSCAFYCRIYIDDNAYDKLKHLILYNYNMIYSVDNLDIFREDPRRKGFYYTGIPVGYIQDKNYLLYTYFQITILYNNNGGQSDKNYIVGFEVEPRSVNFEQNEQCQQNQATMPMEKNKYVTFKYDIKYVQSENSFQHRSEHYYRNLNDQSMIHWFSIMNSIILIILLWFFISSILIKALHKDINKYNRLNTNIFETDDIDDRGWKLVHGDVFRKPINSTFFSAFVGVGIQIIFMVLVCAFVLLIGIYKYKHRYRYIQVMFFMWTLISSISGYSSSRLYKLFKSKHVKLTIFRTSLIYPVILFLIFFLINLVLHYEHSNTAISFSSLTFVCILWFGISVPLICLGSYIGNKKSPIELPVRVNNIPRHIPKQPLLNSFFVSCFLVGLILFATMYTELFFLFTSLWKSNMYYLFGFLFLVIFLLGLLSAQLSIALTYYSLSCEDYNWWWKSFVAPGSSGLFLFLYSIYYFFIKLSISSFAETFIYFAYSFIMSYTCFIYTGTAGFLASFVFLRKIYSSIKVD